MEISLKRWSLEWKINDGVFCSWWGLPTAENSPELSSPGEKWSSLASCSENSIFWLLSKILFFCRFLILHTLQILKVSSESDSKLELNFFFFFVSFSFYVWGLIDLFTSKFCANVPSFSIDGSSGSDKNNSEPERKPKSVPRKEAPPRPTQQSLPASASASASHNVQVGTPCIRWGSFVWMIRNWGCDIKFWGLF